MRELGIWWHSDSGMLNLNTSLSRVNGEQMCSVCNRNEVETVSHFLGVCPVLSGIRNEC